MCLNLEWPFTHTHRHIPTHVYIHLFIYFIKCKPLASNVLVFLNTFVVCHVVF